MRILELTNYTSGSCGVGNRVIRESQMLSQRGNIVGIFSSNFIKGKSALCAESETLGNVKIRRFPAKQLGGESFLNWSFEKEAMAFKPDILISHAYRHLHTLKALKIASKLKVPCILVTHAPFERKKSRTIMQNIIVGAYDYFIGRRSINKFNKVLIIAPWEMSHILKLGANKKNIIYSPNGVKEEFFSSKKSKPASKSIIYMGRISPIKNLELLISVMKIVESGATLTIYGPAENNYLAKLQNIVTSNKLQNRVTIINKEYDLNTQILNLDKSEIFVLPSKSEGMPQSLLEAMARGKIVIGSNITSIKSMIGDGKNGFTFKENDSKDLANTINKVINLSNSKKKNISNAAQKFASRFNWNIIIERLNNLLLNEVNKND